LLARARNRSINLRGSELPFVRDLILGHPNKFGAKGLS
jgi:hypothetical protein